MTLDNPQLLIVAGPNGAGKSTFSKDLSAAGAFIFDADKEAAKIEALYPGLPGESVSYAVEQYFQDCIAHVLKSKTDFTVETNLRHTGLMNIVNRFKENNYVANIIYIGLGDVKQSMDRVTARVNGGGHFVDTGSIRYNFVEGLKNFEYLADRFENVEIIDASGNFYELKSLLSVQNLQIVFVSNDLPEWAKPTISSIVKRFDHTLPERDNDNEHRRGPKR
ncbi:zeta toxin family protein [Mucilaginibacter sp. SMC90]|uniref:zeta toxin family protein n=1 Tax=Mucilaginibacter sp. SMC90 TaxID=2929803 RepID=UPI001FB21D5B|nr:zeta toxin family protein [Mucilaginibacter sp. SMC90]UOE47387.1 zeta toxin family protein [Mucilaginibacter sp. SMC90]